MTGWDVRAAIAIKRDGGVVSSAEVERLVRAYADGDIGDGPMAAFLMACVLQGMDADETAAMTHAFVGSGATVALGDVGRPVVDKHSTGGVSDAVSLIFAPLVAVLGLACVKLSGRALGHTGGTVDKLEAIPGLRVDLSPDEMHRQAAEIGCVIASQTPGVVPADAAVYALRDATGTVSSVPLIAASVMAKKLAVDSDLILLDVKAGSGAFMPDPAAAGRLAKACLAIARDAGRSASAAVTDMSQPLGDAIGNALEVLEAVAVLQGERVGRLRDLTVWLAGRALAGLTGAAFEEACERAAAALDDGSAIERFRTMVDSQGGDPRVGDDPEAVLPSAPVRTPIVAWRDGIVQAIDAGALGAAAAALGAGRAAKGAAIDPAVGIVLEPKIGDTVVAGTPIGVVHARDGTAAERATATIVEAIELGSERAPAPPLIHEWSEEA